MMETFKSKTFSVTIQANPQKVYSFVSNPENMPQWATAFCKSVKREGAHWVIETPMGPFKLRFAAKNDFGVLDHSLSPEPGVAIHVPMRVVPNHDGSEITFTLFKLPSMDDAKFQEDIGLVERDLDTLKKVLEK